ncbi:hypothetical protein K437DRAFT_254551 [Tilletiaria anomala UBC 951]|uniref:Uncharacterized protein n=1 Tax=Tilletiaria anomala (strain ATCC 24038 / CBS 436.72 / UBC 951) TaxID=1037660 RepID=A0A066WNG7_TILAU|nr:uncharacterized protein K437DRAFT_254551 [Tilletiaria anomala UBC 951]KDN52170.1 hypothetical protein K437DRAFT_254551 [Tilletiaria anomala UBC 951]
MPEGRAWFARYHASSVPVTDVHDPFIRWLRPGASDNNIDLVISVIERCDESVLGTSRKFYGRKTLSGQDTLFCSAFTINHKGELLVNHFNLNLQTRRGSSWDKPTALVCM